VGIENLVAKTARLVLRLSGREATALPGKVALALNPKFIERALARIPMGVVFVTGTNGKTTTTNVLGAILRGQGLRVLSNARGSNMNQGIASEIVAQSGPFGGLQADIAVLEVDEAVASRLAPVLHPRFSVVLNVHRDQMDRYGEVDTTAGLLAKVAAATTERVLFDSGDDSTASIAAGVEAGRRASFSGRAPVVAAAAEAGAAVAAADAGVAEDGATSADAGAGTEDAAADCDASVADLRSRTPDSAVVRIRGQEVTVPLHLQAGYQVVDAMAAIGLASLILGDRLDTDRLAETMEDIRPAFGRGEIFEIGDLSLCVVLVKNPNSFNTVLRSRDYDLSRVMIAVNSEYADGRDISWIWDVRMDAFRPAGVDQVAGTRCYDMALRLGYDGIAVGHAAPDLTTGIEGFVSRARAGGGGFAIMFCNYTTMLAARRVLQRLQETRSAAA
jgi:UDP-N-acetylmuramyl tripeptide synthase